MTSDTPPSTNSKAMFWTGCVLSTLPVLMLSMSTVMKLIQHPEAKKGFEGFGYTLDVIVPLGIVELVCTVLYAIPQTAVLGAILLTGYLGGATATHLRVHEAFIPPVILGVILWLGLYLRDARLRALIPLRSQSRG